MKKNSKSNNEQYILHGHIDMPKHEIPGIDSYKVELMNTIFSLLLECNFNLEKFNNLIDTLPSNIEDPEEREWTTTSQIPRYKEIAKAMREEAIRRGLIKE